MKPAIVQQKAVEKASFRVHKLKDGKVLVENPLRVRKNGQEPNDMLVVSREVVEVQDRKLAMPASESAIASSIEVMAVIGVIELCFAKYLLVVTNKSLASTIQAHKVWKVLSGQAIPVGTTADQQVIKVHESDEHTLARYTLDQELLNNIVSIINSQHLYYSTTYDLTHSIQHNALRVGNRATNTVIDDRYFFNLHVQRPILAKATGTGEPGDTSPWVYKMICGFAGAIDIRVSASGVNAANGTADTLKADAGERTYTVALISRLNHRRLGTRYVRRGLDMEGNAANNVEMEQIVFHHDFSIDRGISAFVQIRGSAPAVWGQELNLDYRPELLIADIGKPDIWGSIQKHYSDLRSQYIGEASVANGADFGCNVCVNLLDDKGFEKQLTRTYEETVKRFGDAKVQYEEFPVNKWCKKMNFRNMDILVDRMRDRLVNSGWLVGEGEVPVLNPEALLTGTPVPASNSPSSLRVHRIQTGLARVSCLDSLDRTNLTCSIFARYILPYQVASLADPSAAGKARPIDGASADDVRDPVAGLRAALDPSFRTLTNLWADSGDAVSLLYAGTRALKADVTRTGKRQWIRGSLDDGLNSLTRYYLNNFADGRKQDGYDLWSGKVSHDTIKTLAETEGTKKAKRLQKPFLEKGKGLTGMLIPGFVIDRVEPLLQAASEFAQSTMEDQMKKAQKLQEASAKHLGPVTSTPDQSSFFAFLVSAIKIYAPEQVTNVLEFVVAMVVFFYVLVFVKIFQLRGQTIVDRPKLSYEYATIHELLD
ncbi:hypothetical protein HDU96_002206 [Phlyctochytrium bullatum]|nr:hypothetical protein HDU96_002206 [Phlyctochytrium bullatum]